MKQLWYILLTVSNPGTINKVIYDIIEVQYRHSKELQTRRAENCLFFTKKCLEELKAAYE